MRSVLTTIFSSNVQHLHILAWESTQMVQRAGMSWDQWRTAPRIVANSVCRLLPLSNSPRPTSGYPIRKGHLCQGRGWMNAAIDCAPRDELGARQFLRVLTSLMEHSSSTTNHLFFLISCFPPRDSNWLLSVWWIRVRLSWPDSVKRAVQFVSHLCFRLVQRELFHQCGMFVQTCHCFGVFKRRTVPHWD